MPTRNPSEDAQALLDLVSTGQLGRRRFLILASASGLTACYSAPAVEHAIAAGENQARNQAGSKDSYDYIVVGAGAAGSVVAGELSKTGANVLVVEAGGADDAPTISNPSVWFRNVGGPLDWHLPIAPAPPLNNRKFNMALGHVLGGGSSINALVWSRGMDLDYDGWARSGATGWAFKDVLPMFKSQEDWEGGANDWRGVGGPVHVRNVHDPHPTSPALIEAARQMGMPVIDDMNGPMRPGAGYNNMNIAADGSRVSAARAFLRPNLGRPNLTLLLNANVTKVVFEGDRAVGVEIAEAANVRTVRATREVILSAGTIHTSQLLMLSGIGNADELKKLGIASVANLRGVGQNLQDHVLLHGVVYKYKGKMPDRPVDSNATEGRLHHRPCARPADQPRPGSARDRRLARRAHHRSQLPRHGPGPGRHPSSDRGGPRTRSSKGIRRHSRRRDHPGPERHQQARRARSRADRRGQLRALGRHRPDRHGRRCRGGQQPACTRGPWAPRCRRVRDAINRRCAHQRRVCDDRRPCRRHDRGRELSHDHPSSRAHCRRPRGHDRVPGQSRGPSRRDHPSVVRRHARAGALRRLGQLHRDQHRWCAWRLVHSVNELEQGGGALPARRRLRLRDGSRIPALCRANRRAVWCARFRRGLPSGSRGAVPGRT